MAASKTDISRLYERYKTVYMHLDYIQKQYEETERHLSDFEVEDEAARKARIKNFDKQLKDIARYYETVEYFRRLAERNITTKNVPTLKPLEIDLNSLKHDLQRIDYNNPNDPYAYRLYIHARCNEIYLEQKQKEFEAKRALLLSGENTELEAMKKAAEDTKKQLEQDCATYIKGREFNDFAEMVRRIHGRFDHDLYSEHGLKKPADFIMNDTGISFGMRAQPLPVIGDEAVKLTIEKLSIERAVISEKKNYFDKSSKNILLPVEYDINDEVCIYVRCSAVKSNICFKGINSFILNRIRRTEPGDRRLVVSFFDALHFNNTELKALKPIENTILLEKVPQSSEEIEDKLRNIVASFSDIDEKLQDVETVQEYNEDDSEDDNIDKRIVVINGYPKAYNDNEKKCIDRIIYNHKRYGISLILVENTGYDKQKDKDDDKFGSSADFYFIDMPVGASSTIRWTDKNAVGFRWYEYDYKKHPLPKDFVDQVRSEEKEKNKTSTVYTQNYSLEKWDYKSKKGSERKSITLPYGVEGDNEIKSISFTGENFAAYLMGASGSGKSTLLHTLITGIIRNYHPDDVELWLADFKMAEFSQYIDPMPPHIKYILLDESRELVFDLVDKLTEKMMERQGYFMLHRDVKKVEDVPSSVYMPVIFVILDEFSIMSQVLEENDSYRIKLQNLLAKGRALGIKFIFSSQSYMTGIRGLTNTAKEQIQSRIAMKNNIDEIEETLELPRFLKTEKNVFMIETLPVHVALRKYRQNDEDLVLERVNVMYFKGEAEKAYAPQRKMIRRINNRMREMSEIHYKGSEEDTFVSKNPVIVDGNSFDAFIDSNIKRAMLQYRITHIDEIYDDDVLIALGSPRRMENYIFSSISNESRENLLLIADSSEQARVASIILSIAKSFKIHNNRLQIWAYEKNRVLRRYITIFKSIGIEIITGIDAICDEIRTTKNNIIEGRLDNRLVILLGMDHIYLDFDYVGGTRKEGYKSKYDNLKDVAATTPEELDEAKAFNSFMVKWKNENLEKLKSEGKSKEEIAVIRRAAISKFKAEFLANKEKTKADTSKVEVKEDSNNGEKNNIPEHGAYNAADDFIFVVKQGSRLGVHFMLNVSAYTDLKSMGMKLEYFRNKMSFTISVEDSRMVFGNGKIGSNLPEHICQFDNTLDRYSFRPYLHSGIDWDGWSVKGETIINPYKINNNDEEDI